MRLRPGGCIRSGSGLPEPALPGKGGAGDSNGCPLLVSRTWL